MKTISSFWRRASRGILSRTGISAGLALMGSACDSGKLVPSIVEGPNRTPVEPQKPRLVHTGADLKVYAWTAVWESVYVANAAPGEWEISLLVSPPGTVLQENRLVYILPEGLSGPQTVHAIATKDSLRLEMTWTVFAHPEQNRSPVIEMDTMLHWGIVGTTYQIPFRIRDPEGDSLTIHASLPQGAVLHDSLIVWTIAPSTKGSRGVAKLSLTAKDSYGLIGTSLIEISVFENDPRPMTATLVQGRIWHMRGYVRTRNSKDTSLNDSTYYARAVTLQKVDLENGVITLHIRDTLSGTRAGLRDTTFRISSPNGQYLPNQIEGDGALVFAWPTAAEAVLETEFLLEDQALPARRELNTTRCMDEFYRRGIYGCASDERIFADGLGLVYYRKDARAWDGVQNDREEFYVWDVSDP
jgi:hypothetical protein